THILPGDWYAAAQPVADQRVLSAHTLLSSDDRPTAVVAYELEEAMAVVHAAPLLGLRIPEDLSIILFHNRIEARYFLPFQTIGNMMEEVGTQAIDLLLDKIKEPESSLPTRIVPMAMLGGATCAPPPRL